MDTRYLNYGSSQKMNNITLRGRIVMYLVLVSSTVLAYYGLTQFEIKLWDHLTAF